MKIYQRNNTKKLTPTQEYPNYKDLSNAYHNEWKKIMVEHVSKKLQNTIERERESLKLLGKK